MNKEEEIQQKLNEKLSEFNLTQEDLTSDELYQLRQEIITEMNGGAIIDGVLSDASIFYRNLKSNPK